MKPPAVDQLAWLLEEAGRGQLDPKGKDFARVQAVVDAIADEAAARACGRVRDECMALLAKLERGEL